MWGAGLIRGRVDEYVEVRPEASIPPFATFVSQGWVPPAPPELTPHDEVGTF